MFGFTIIADTAHGNIARFDNHAGLRKNFFTQARSNVVGHIIDLAAFRAEQMIVIMDIVVKMAGAVQTANFLNHAVVSQQIEVAVHRGQADCRRQRLDQGIKLLCCRMYGIIRQGLQDYISLFGVAHRFLNINNDNYYC